MKDDPESTAKELEETYVEVIAVDGLVQESFVEVISVGGYKLNFNIYCIKEKYVETKKKGMSPTLKRRKKEEESANMSSPSLRQDVDKNKTAVFSSLKKPDSRKKKKVINFIDENQDYCRSLEKVDNLVKCFACKKLILGEEGKKCDDFICTNSYHSTCVDNMGFICHDQILDF